MRSTFSGEITLIYGARISELLNSELQTISIIPRIYIFNLISLSLFYSRVTERHGHRLLQCLVGDSLLEPFWPTGIYKHCLCWIYTE